jgi:predicted Rossmann-fold nucleotide-binding protein
LYSAESLYDGYVRGEIRSYDQTPDARIYQHYLETGGPRPCSIIETLARRLHDHAITDALEEVIAGRNVVAIMGGHSMKRDEAGYLQIALLSRRLSADGFLMSSGGGPGAMEAANLGAAFSSRSETILCEAVAQLAETPTFSPIGPWLDSAFMVREEHLSGAATMGKSIGIPTWYFGHEPPNVFATHIAKYFANSVREEGLVSIPLAGIVFAPGSAGTIQEIFQDATQNHYLTMGIASPMVFLGRDFWTETTPIFPLLQRLSSDKSYHDLLLVTDDIQEAALFLNRFAAATL